MTHVIDAVLDLLQQVRRLPARISHLPPPHTSLERAHLDPIHKLVNHPSRQERRLLRRHHHHERHLQEEHQRALAIVAPVVIGEVEFPGGARRGVCMDHVV